jgi:hypothetical protein
MELQATAQLLGNFGEFFGAIAVVATLAFLASQIRQSNRWQQTEAFNASTSEARRWVGRIAENGELNEIYLKGRSDYALLTDQERSRFDCLIAEQFSFFESYLTYDENGNMPYDIKPGLKIVIETYTAEGWLQPWWRENRMMLTLNTLIEWLDEATQERRSMLTSES